MLSCRYASLAKCLPVSVTVDLENPQLPLQDRHFGASRPQLNPAPHATARLEVEVFAVSVEEVVQLCEPMVNNQSINRVVGSDTNLAAIGHLVSECRNAAVTSGEALHTSLFMPTL
jgi:hypothetical protein